ncbi:mechanosensitive ion channel domain-containing protein [Synechococcus sp. UW140]|uniref:mechanosensitive ion channel family protein n=1 Tax=Synechococcus sp. UW140 TaxID=368503 RepID=UPI0025F519DC|nr:mechanosensitive ion channel domain-containing protein [Synechococcus sp. UW140]
MNSFSDIFGYIASEISRVSVLLQIATFALALISWLVLTKLFALENRRWPLEKRFKYITTFKQLANELLLLFVLRAFTLALDYVTHVAGLLFFVSGFYGLCLFSRLFIVFLKFYAPISIVSRFDICVLRPSYVIIGVLSFLSEILDLPSLLATPLIIIGGDNFSFYDFLLLLFGSYFLATGTGLPAWGLTWIAAKVLHLSKPALRAAELIVRYLIVAIGLVSILSIIGVNYTFLAAVGGGLSVGLGFGLKEVFSNFISGLWLLIEGAVRPGDVLLLESGTGEDPCEVLELGMRATTLWRDRDNVELVVPNQLFFTQQMVTYSGVRDRYRRGQVLIGVAYRHTPEQVIAILEAVAATVPRILDTPAPKGLLLRYGDSAITYAIRYWIEDPMNGIGISSQVSIAIWNAFSSHGIEIPYPQRVLHAKGVFPGAIP